MNLVKHIHVRKDLESSWIIFDHVKQVVGVLALSL